MADAPYVCPVCCDSGEGEQHNVTPEIAIYYDLEDMWIGKSICNAHFVEYNESGDSKPSGAPDDGRDVGDEELAALEAAALEDGAPAPADEAVASKVETNTEGAAAEPGAGNPSSADPRLPPDLLEMARKGVLVWKWKYGKKQRRYVWFDDDKVWWGAKVDKPKGFTDIAELTRIAKGQPSGWAGLKKKTKQIEAAADTCFALFFRDRTLDLQTETVELRDQWVHIFRCIQGE